MDTILITGGSGLVGRALSGKLAEKGYRVTILSRDPGRESGFRNYFWDPENNVLDDEAIATADFIVHLAGENLGEKRWTPKRKQEIIDSRVRTGEMLFNKTIETGKRIRAFISSSAVGYYGAITSEKVFREPDPPATDFAAGVCRLWEEQAAKFERSGIRTVVLRTGIVLAPKGGALEKMALVSRLGIGSPIGTGDQYLPWIHIGDLCNIYIKAIEDAGMNGAYNAAAPDNRTNREFTKELASVLARPYIAPRVPAFLMKILYGEMASMLLEGSRVSSEKIIKSGYTFIFPVLRDALNDVLRRL